MSAQAGMGDRVIVVEPLGALSRDTGAAGTVLETPQVYPFDVWVVQADAGRPILALAVESGEGAS